MGGLKISNTRRECHTTFSLSTDWSFFNDPKVANGRNERRFICHFTANSQSSKNDRYAPPFKRRQETSKIPFLRLYFCEMKACSYLYWLCALLCIAQCWASSHLCSAGASCAGSCLVCPETTPAGQYCFPTIIPAKSSQYECCGCRYERQRHQFLGEKFFGSFENRKFSTPAPLLSPNMIFIV